MKLSNSLPYTHTYLLQSHVNVSLPAGIKVLPSHRVREPLSLQLSTKGDSRFFLLTPVLQYLNIDERRAREFDVMGTMNAHQQR